MTRDEPIVTKWMIALVIALVMPIGAASYLMGQLYSRNSALERMVKEHESTIVELISTTVALKGVVEGHYATIRDDVDGLEQQLVRLQQETSEKRENTAAMLRAMTTLQKNVSDLRVVIREEIRASRPTE